MKPGQLGASFRDPSGFMFRQGNELYRQINTRYEKEYKWLKSSGQYDKLTTEGRLVSHENEDSQVQRLLATREDIFPDYNIAGFKNSLSGYFRILEKTSIEGTDCTLYMLEQHQ